MNIVFVGDIFLGGDILNEDVTNIVKSSKYNQAFKRIANLEQPVSDNERIADKCTLYTGSFATRQIKDLRIDAVNLAHNHIQDKGIDGITETLNHLKNDNIGHFGAGNNLIEAKKPYWINEDLCILGYCEYDKPYLKQIQVAKENSPGVNPLRYKSITEDLEKLPEGKKAVLYFHWGREHVWFPPRNDIYLAKRLLEHEKVALIVGMHCHRIQGYISHNNKRAYMSIGNFLFPNFFIKPPTQIAYPKNKLTNYMVTKQYHSVSELTYKKWRLANRISLLLEYDTESGEINHLPMLQKDEMAIVHQMNGFCKKIIMLWISFLSLVYIMPAKSYNIIEKISSNLTYKIWVSQILFFKMRQIGYKPFLKKGINILYLKIKSKN